MALHIIDKKRLDLTDSEWSMYNNICKSYDIPPSVKGSDLFADLFEVDGAGIIIFLKPPSKRQTSMEIFLFLASIMINQHLRSVYKQAGDLKKEVMDKLAEMDEKINKLAK